MRYGLQWADGDPFPRDTEVGVRLEDETVEVVPEDCPPCEECSECVPSCDRVWFQYHTVRFTGEVLIFPYYSELLEGSVGDDVVSDPNLAGDNLKTFLEVLPVMEKCGHRTRAVVDVGTGTMTSLPEELNNAAPGDPENHFGVTFVWDSPTVTGTTYMQMQIDLTDAAEGFETWTDFGPRIVLFHS